MKHITILFSFLILYSSASACTNFIVTAGASTDGSTMVTYAADSHWLYGCLYNYVPVRKLTPTISISNWDDGKYIGEIEQVAQTYSTVGNMNEYSVIITETTWGGREELIDKTGKIDYGSLIYVTLQRARTAKEAIAIIVDLATRYGYQSEGESFSIADPREAWIMDIVGKGTKLDQAGNNTRKGIVWVARRIPDGYVSGHANQCRITTFPMDDPTSCLYSKDVVSFARDMGYFSGKDSEFSFADAYNPINFENMRGCEARVWSFFRSVTDGMDKYLDYALGYNSANRMPLWVKPTHKISPKQLFDAMRDHYEGTPMDMTKDIGAGGSHCPYRWRPMYFTVDGKEYLNERATATQQTGFWMCGQARNGKTGILWFGVDDTATSALTPVYCNSTEVAECLKEGNGSLLEYSPTSMFWLFNRISNFAYLRYDLISASVRKAIDRWENDRIAEVAAIDAATAVMSPRKARKRQTEYSVATAENMFARFSKLENYLLVKYMDGNVKAEDENGFITNGSGQAIPDKLEQPGYSETFLRAIAKENGKFLEVRK